MTLLPFKLKKVADGLNVRVSNHFHYTDFGVTDSREQNHYGRRYVCTGTPGTGFIERESESHSYREFVRGHFRNQRPKYWNLFFNREPDFDREITRARAALDQTTDPMKRNILDAYVNALSVAAVEEEIERIQRGIKDRIGHHDHKKYYVSVLSHYKHKVSQLRDDMESVEFNIRNTCTDEQYQAYLRLVDMFIKVASCRRIWNQNEASRLKYDQVFFDLGTFDFISSECYRPILRSSKGVDYYLLPTVILVVRSSVDFDVVPLADVTLVCQEMAIQETIEVLSSRLGDAASMLRIPTFDQTWYFNHVRPIMHFAGAYDELRALSTK